MVKAYKAVKDISYVVSQGYEGDVCGHVDRGQLFIPDFNLVVSPNGTGLQEMDEFQRRDIPDRVNGLPQGPYLADVELGDGLVSALRDFRGLQKSLRDARDDLLKVLKKGVF
ncbi:hypothetical protein COU60_03685 [Candidatus Pacearchaeota archaeon CG10_big_fil_rev_8_21_14_0_10_34_76]|nr:MAG: hypothetical protein COU60_03685 [Candidatus Pacearchaeota archaeon CG10_big_fil_rev_8_21_14_0_10_34_76]